MGKNLASQKCNIVTKIGGEIIYLAKQDFGKSAIALGKEFGMIKGNLVTNNVYSWMKGFLIKM